MSLDETNCHTAPWCPLPTWHPSRCHADALALAFASGFEKAVARGQKFSYLAKGLSNPLDLVDDYGKVEAHDWLSAPGGFR